MNSIRAVVFAIILVFTQELITESAEVDFPPLPKGKEYKLKELRSSNGWSLEGLHSVAKETALVVKQEPPYDLLSGVIKQAEGKHDNSLTVKKVVDYEKPIIAVGALSLVFAVVLPVVGIVLCCCRWRNRCGGYLDDTKMKRYPHMERRCYSISLFLCSLLLIIWSSFILVSSIRMSNSIPVVQKVLDNSFDDISTYKVNTFQELNHLAGKDWALSLVTFLRQVENLTSDVVKPVLEKGSPKVERLVNSVNSVAKAVERAGQTLIGIENTVRILVRGGENVSVKLEEVKLNLTNTKEKCSMMPSCNSSVTIPPVENLETAANFSKVPNVTETREKVQRVVQSNLTQEAIKGNKRFREIPKKVNNLTADFIAKFDNFTKELENINLDVLQPYEDKVDKYLEKYVLPGKSKVNKYLAPNGIVTKYDSYRHIVFIVFGVLLLVSGLVVLAGVSVGMAGASRFDTPSTRSRVTHIGGKIILWSAWLLFALVFFINLLAGVTFVLGTNASVVCHSMSDLELLEKTVDNPNMMGGYPLARTLFNDSSIKLTLSGVLRQCETNKSPWTVLQLDRLFNLSDVLNYKEKVPAFEEVFRELNSTVSDTTVLTDTASREVNNSRDAGVEKTNFTQYEEQLSKPIVKVNLSDFVHQLRTAANQARNISSVAAELNGTADDLERLQQQNVFTSEQNVRRLGSHVDDLRQQGNNIANGVVQVYHNLGELKFFLEQDALHIVNKAVQKHWGKLFHTVDEFLDLVISKVRGEVGKCKPLRNIYDQATNSVCNGYFAGLNGAWISFGLCSLTMLITIILCVKASKYFMLADGNLSLDSVTIAEDLELPWGDTVRLGPMKESNLNFQSIPIGYNAYGQST